MKRFIHVWRRRFYPWVPFTILLCAVACEGMCTKPCGGFAFHDRGVLDTSSVNGWNMDLDFSFTPTDCGVSCTCNKVCYIQMVRSVDNGDGTYIYPTSEKQGRATAEGWYIDRLEGKIWGYYGRNDDGSFASTVTVGSETSTANLSDFPQRGESEPWIDFWWLAVTVPVCIDNAGSTCNDQLLGYYEWGWKVDPAGAVTTINWTAGTGLKHSFDDAVAAWNVQAPTLGKNTFPAFTRLSE